MSRFVDAIVSKINYCFPSDGVARTYWTANGEIKILNVC